MVFFGIMEGSRRAIIFVFINHHHHYDHFNGCTDLGNLAPFLQFLRVPMSQALSHDSSSDGPQAASGKNLWL